MSRLADFPIFKDMPSDHLSMLDAIVVKKQFGRGHVFFNQGDGVTSVTGALYMLLEGRVEVHVAPSAAGAVEVRRALGAGSMFGLLGMIDDTPRTATCTALDTCEVAYLPRNAFMQLQSSHLALGAQFQLGVARQLASDLRALTARLQMAVDGREEALG